jgi:iron complex outermembrane receptor protein
MIAKITRPLFAGLMFASVTFSFSTLSIAAERSIAIEEVVVTARKQEESAQDVPISITALSEELTSSTIRTLTDLTGYIPNATIAEFGQRGGGGAAIQIRGISATRNDDNSFDSPVAVMIDGIYLGSLAGQVLENFDLERIEVLRGPQGTLFGKNTVGGVVHAIRSRPTGEFGARVKVTLGEEGQEELRAVVNTSLIEDELAAKFFATSIKDDGFMKNVTIGGNTGETDYQNYGLTLLWTPNDRFESTFTIERFDDQSQLSSYNTNYNAAPGVLPPPTDPNDSDFSGGLLTCVFSIIGALQPGPAETCRNSRETPSVSVNDTENEAELVTDALTLNMRYDLNDNLTLVSTTGYRELEENYIYDFDGSPAPFITIERWNDYDQFSQELRLDGTYENVSFTAGVYYFNSEFEQDWSTGGAFWGILFGAALAPQANWELCQTGNAGGLVFGVACDPTLPSYPTEGFLAQILYETQETTSYAAFAQMDWQFAEDWTLTLGLRATREEKDFVAAQAYLTAIARERFRDHIEFADLDNEWSETSPKVGITYQLNDDAIVYATYAEGFNSGGYFGVDQNIEAFIKSQYDPETSETYEIGYKAMLLDNRLRLNVAWFRNDFTNKIESSVQVERRPGCRLPRV